MENVFRLIGFLREELENYGGIVCCYFFFLERSIVGCWVRGYLDDILEIVYMFM